jgi:hypothetical protein
MRTDGGRQGVVYLGEMLGKNNSLKYLDISRNALGFGSINALQCCGCAKRVEMRVEGPCYHTTHGGRAIGPAPLTIARGVDRQLRV